MQALDRAKPKFATLVAPVADMRPFGLLRARLAAPGGWRPLCASVLLHGAVLVGLVALHHATLRDAEAPPVQVTLTPGDPDARVGPHTGIAWDAAAEQAAVVALLDTRRASTLLGEVVISPGPSPRRVSRPNSSRRAPPLEAALARAEPTPAAAPPAHRPTPAATPTEAVLTLPLVPEPTTLAAAAPVEPAPPDPAAAPPVQRPDPPTPPRRVADDTPAPRPERVATPAPAAIPAALPAASPASPAPASRADQGYFDAVLKHLRTFKDYPGLDKYHAAGTVVVALTIGRDGTVLSAEVRRSSNYSFFDRAGLDLIHRASPMPVPPAGMAVEALAIQVPITFRYD